MSDAELENMLVNRQGLRDQLAVYRVPMGEMSQTMRTHIDRMLETCWNDTRLIVAELARRGGKFKHWSLTPDRLNFTDARFVLAPSRKQQRGHAA